MRPSDRPLTYQQMVEAMERALMGVKHELREHRHPIHDKTKLWTAPPSGALGASEPSPGDGKRNGGAPARTQHPRLHTVRVGNEGERVFGPLGQAVRQLRGSAMKDMEDVWLDSGMKVPVGRWANDPCWRCGRQPAKDEIVKLDWMAHTVLCAACDREDQRGLAQALADASKRWWAQQAEHNGTKQESDES